MKRIIVTLVAAMSVCLAASAQQLKYVDAAELNIIGKVLPTPKPFTRVDTEKYHFDVSGAEVFNFKTIHMRSLFLSRSQRKNGGPRRAVITPAGISAGLAAVLPTVSQSTTSKAPERADSGIRWRFPAPAASRTAWGTIRPTKPSSPAILTAAAASSDADTRSTTRDKVTSTPAERAVSSPSASRSSLRLNRAAPANPAPAKGRTEKKSSKLRIDRLPIVNGSMLPALSLLT